MFLANLSGKLCNFLLVCDIKYIHNFTTTVVDAEAFGSIRPEELYEL